MKNKYYLVLAIALVAFFLLLVTGLGYTPWVSAFMKLPPEMEILLFTIQAGTGAAALGHFLGYGKAKRAKKNSAGKLEYKKPGLHAVAPEKKKRKAISLKYVVLLVIMLVIFTIPFIINPTGNFSGSDSQGPDAIESEGYTPWIDSLLTLSHTEEILFFSIQIGIGGLIIGYFVGYERGKRAMAENIRLEL